MNKSLLLSLVLCCTILGISSCQHGTSNQLTTTEVTFVNDVGTVLHAKFNTSQNTVSVVFTDYKVTLPKVVSASGAKYASGTDIFWNKGSEVLYKKDGKTLFEGTEQ